MDLDVTEVEDWLTAVSEVLRLEGGGGKGAGGHRATVEAEMQRIFG